MHKDGSVDQQKFTTAGNLRGAPPENSAGRCCHGCGVVSPETETSYTLISSRYGWRLELVPDLSGQKISIWRCPDCWRNRRAKRDADTKLR